jgi:hypothetical protein
VEVTATAGIVRPILERAEPSARFRLDCRQLAWAARTAAHVSGSNTNIAITIPITAFGAPAVSVTMSPTSMTVMEMVSTSVPNGPRDDLGVMYRADHGTDHRHGAQGRQHRSDVDEKSDNEEHDCSGWQQPRP